jgi:hypothetical protein
MYRRNKAGKGVISPSEFFAHNAKFKLEMIATYSTLTEVVGLAIIANARGVDIWNALNRYALVGFLELVATFIFMEIGEACIKNLVLHPLFKPLVDNEDKPGWASRVIASLLGLILTGVILFLCFFPLVFPTLIIYYLYAESIGQLLLTFQLPAHAYDIWSSIVINVNPNPADIGVLEMAAIIMILINPILNGLQLIMSFREHVPKFRAEMYKNVTGAKGNPTTPTNNSYTTEDVVRAYIKMAGQGRSFDTLWNNLQASLGKATSLHGGVPVRDEILNKTKTADQVEQDIVNMLLGSCDPTNKKYIGIKGYEWLEAREKQLDGESGRQGEIAIAEKVVNEAATKHTQESDAGKKSALKKTLDDAQKKLDALKLERNGIQGNKDSCRNRLISIAGNLDK